MNSEAAAAPIERRAPNHCRSSGQPRARIFKCRRGARDRYPSRALPNDGPAARSAAAAGDRAGASRPRAPVGPGAAGCSSSCSSRNKIGPIASSSPGCSRRFFEQPAVDAHAVAAAEIANQYSIICCRDATVATRNLRRIDADVAFEVPADQEDRPVECDRGGRSLHEWDDAE